MPMALAIGGGTALPTYKETTEDAGKQQVRDGKQQLFCKQQ